MVTEVAPPACPNKKAAACLPVQGPHLPSSCYCSDVCTPPRNPCSCYLSMLRSRMGFSTWKWNYCELVGTPLAYTPVTGQNVVNITICKLRTVGELDFLRYFCKVFLTKLVIFLHKSVISNLVYDLTSILHAGYKYFISWEWNVMEETSNLFCTLRVRQTWFISTPVGQNTERQRFRFYWF